MRHSLASADATLRYGEKVARMGSRFRESTNTETPSGKLDLQNDGVGRSLALKHRDMGAVAKDLVALIEQGPSTEPGRLTWVTDDKPENFTPEFPAKTKAAVEKAYEER